MYHTFKNGSKNPNEKINLSKDNTIDDDPSIEHLQEMDKQIDEKMVTLQPDDEEWIYLKMDNMIFTTTRSTLTLDKNSLLYIMFKKDSPYHLPRDLQAPDQPYLFDRNPKYFEPILNYLRTGEIIFDNNINPKGILMEAKYFNIQGMIEALQPIVEKEEIKKKTHKSPDLTREFIVKSLITCSNTNTNLRFQGLNLSGLNLSGLDLSGINFQKSNLQGTKFNGATLDGADFRECNLTDACFTKASLSNANLSKAIMRNCQMIACDLRCADIQFCDLTNAVLRKANLTNANLSNAVLHNADVSFANFKGAKLSRAILTGINRQGANLSMGGVVG